MVMLFPAGSPLFKFTGKSRLQILANSRTIARDRVPRDDEDATGEDRGLVVRPKGSVFSEGSWIPESSFLVGDDILGSSLPGRIDRLRALLSPPPPLMELLAPTKY
ncbi:hypothetical protein MLD38_005878 [Melastoma candidum]|uniref:Uncharacterized protein n=1 Tax=Melastoma candidum TaxID=119954 RepID=A0ACB9RL28_9MYRT|nr:hypothetical protein MLD38_005878 [Melastoma candidum]